MNFRHKPVSYQTGFSRLLDKIIKVLRFIEDPYLIRLKLQGALPWTFRKLSIPWLQSFGIDTVLDIGANTGQFSKTITALLPEAKIISFEPLPECFIQLQKLELKNQNFQALNIGLGDKSGHLSFERNNYTASSSFLKMTSTHKESFPFTVDSRTVEVEISRLDDVCKNLSMGNSLLIKIDVQGYEDKVLLGGEKTIQSARIVIIETSFVTLYENQPLFDDIYSLMLNWGFSYHGALEQLQSPSTGQTLQEDAVFIKKIHDQ